MNTFMGRLILRGKREREAFIRRMREVKWSLSSEGKENRRKLVSLKGKFSGRRCFIMGNGPSLLKCDLTLLRNEITICSNANYLIWDKIGFVPTFLTVEDCLVAEDRSSELNSIHQTMKVFPFDLRKFLSYSNDTVYVNFIRDYKGFPKFSAKFEDIVYWGGTVSMLNLQLAYYLGCTKIYLIGFDHHYAVPDKIVNHVITSETDDVNHIHPNYFGKGYRWHDPDVERMERGYAKARSFMDSRGIEVRNATVGGELEVFGRTDYLSLFDSIKE